MIVYKLSQYLEKGYKTMDKDLLQGQIYKCNLGGLSIKDKNIRSVIVVNLINDKHIKDCFVGMPLDNLNNVDINEVRVLSKRRIIGNKIGKLTDQQLKGVLSDIEIYIK